MLISNIDVVLMIQNYSIKYVTHVSFQRFIENTNVGVCQNELLQLEYGEVQSRVKLRTCNALFTALDSVSDSVEISNEDHEIVVSS